jgi:hypothetical protein
MRTMRKMDRVWMLALAMAAVIVLLIATATPSHAADRRKLGRYVDEIEPGMEYVIESVRFPGMVASPDRREKYKDYITLTKWDAEHPNTAQQIWHFTNTDSKWVDDPMLGEYEWNFTREGMFQMSNFTNYLEHPSKTLRLITYDAKSGYTAKPEEYNSDGSTKDTQWFTGTVLRVEDGKTIWKIVGVSSNCRLAPGGWSEVYLREVEWE